MYKITQLSILLLISFLSGQIYASGTKASAEGVKDNQFQISDSQPANIRSLTIVQESYETPVDNIEIVRTAHSPKKVKIKMTIPLWDQAKVRGDQFRVRYSSRICKTKTQKMRAQGANCQSKVECIRKDRFGNCVRSQTVTHCRQHYSSAVCQSPAKKMTVMCQGSRTAKVTIDFSKLDSLKEGERETFILRGWQVKKGKKRVRFSLAAKETQEDYIIKYRNFLGKKIKVFSRSKKQSKEEDNYIF
jgi:hypothetical protein